MFVFRQGWDSSRPPPPRRRGNGGWLASGLCGSSFAFTHQVLQLAKAMEAQDYVTATKVQQEPGAWRNPHAFGPSMLFTTLLL